MPVSSPTEHIFYPANEAEMLALGQQLLQDLTPPKLIFLHGDLGAGKTTLVRGILKALGWQGKVKSPTFTVIEPYDLGELQVYHVDLYRLTSPDELAFMGIRDYFNAHSLVLIEWPSRALTDLPIADIDCYIEMLPKGREVKWTHRRPL